MKQKKIITAVALAAGIAGTGLLYGAPPQEKDIRTIQCPEAQNRDYDRYRSCRG